MRLLTDAMLGRLTTYFRMCGYDTAYTPDLGIESDDAIREYAQSENRLLLTRDRELAASAEDALLLRRREIADQLQEVVDAGLDMSLPEVPERCSACNGTVERVPSDGPTPEYAPDPRSVDIWRCRQCKQHYWKGSHWDDVEETLAGLDCESNPQRE